MAAFMAIGPNKVYKERKVRFCRVKGVPNPYACSRLYSFGHFMMYLNINL